MRRKLLSVTRGTIMKKNKPGSRPCDGLLLSVLGGAVIKACILIYKSGNNFFVKEVDGNSCAE